MTKFEIFEKRRHRFPRTVQWLCHIGTNGRMTFSLPVADLIKSKGKPFALLLWNKETETFAVKPCDAHPHAYTLSMKRGQTAVAARGFLKWIGVNWSQKASYPVKWNAEAEQLEVDIRQPP